MPLGPVQKPEILDIITEENVVKISFKVPEDLAYLEGHFNDFPIVPGVVQLNWADFYAREHFEVTGWTNEINQCKFSSVMRPLETVTLTLEHEPEKSQVKYSYSTGEKKYSSGRLTYLKPEDENNDL